MMEMRMGRMAKAQLSRLAPSGLAEWFGPRWMVMSGGQQRCACTAMQACIVCIQLPPRHIWDCLIPAVT